MTRLLCRVCELACWLGDMGGPSVIGALSVRPVWIEMRRSGSHWKSYETPCWRCNIDRPSSPCRKERPRPHYWESCQPKHALKIM